MKFNSTDEIKKHFDLASDTTSDLKSQLHEIIKKIHPDKNGGSFRTKADEKYFLEIQDAIEFLDNSNNLPVTRQELSLITQILKDILPASQIKQSENYLILENKIQTSIKFYKSKHLFPKISTSALAIVLTAIWLFPNSVSEHPVLKNYFKTDNPTFGIFWFGSVFLCAMTWLILKAVEKRDKELKRGLSLETNLNKIFTRFIDYRYHGKVVDDFFYFNKDELIDFILEYDFKNDRVKVRKFKKSILDIYTDFLMKLIPVSSNVDIDLAQSVGDVIIEKGTAKKVVERVDSFSINDTFRTKIQPKHFMKPEE